MPSRKKNGSSKRIFMKIAQILSMSIFFYAACTHAVTIFIKSPFGNTFEIMIDKENATIQDLKDELITNSKYIDEQKFALELLKAPVNKPNAIRILSIYSNIDEKPLTNDANLVNEQNYFFKTSEFPLSEDIENSINIFDQLLILFDPYARKQSKKFLDTLAQNIDLFSDIFVIAHYLEKQNFIKFLIRLLPEALIVNSSMLNNKNFFIPNIEIQDLIKQKLIAEYEKRLIDQIKNISTIESSNQNYTVAACDKTGTYIAAGTTDGNIAIFDITNKAKPTLFTTLFRFIGTHVSGVKYLGWDASGNYLASISFGNMTTIWDLTKKSEPNISAIIGKKNVKINSFCWDFTEIYIAFASRDQNGTNSIDIWDISDKTKPTQSTKLKIQYQIHSVAWNPTGNYLAIGLGDNTIQIWNVSYNVKPLLVSTIDDETGGHTNTVTHVIWDKSGNFLASASLDKQIKIWDLSNKNSPSLSSSINPDIKHDDIISSIAWDNSANNLAITSDEGLKIWNTTNKAHPFLSIVQKSNGIDSISLVAFITDNYLMTNSNAIKIWKIFFDDKEYNLQNIITKLVLLDKPNIKLQQGGWAYETVYPMRLKLEAIPSRVQKTYRKFIKKGIQKLRKTSKSFLDY